MILYHFTNLRDIERIRVEGLSRGTIILGGTRKVHAISLTTSDQPHGLGVALENEPMSQADRDYYFAQTGTMPRADAFFCDNSQVRIKLMIPTTDHRLVSWGKYRRKLEHAQLEALERGERPETWWVYRGVISPTRFIGIERRADL
jgi:hypothetical protein